MRAIPGTITWYQGEEDEEKAREEKRESRERFYANWGRKVVTRG